MKVKSIKFFAPEENAAVQKPAPKLKPLPTGYISATGKLVFPSATLEELGIEAASTQFKIGTDEGKRTIKSLYLVPSDSAEQAFPFERSGRGGYVIPLALILKKGGIDFESTKVTFSVSLFHYDEGVVGYQLIFENSAPKPEYTGKPRGRKPRAASVSE
ncbi:hypothetical protein MUK70_08485 [Dyadobacter chenwenxiniae]|uniref:Uncharacterized protein n=1 Tax=Dyadobacter chenwenxiniae TaxID=2906456 RepID=A0A9X1PMQ4_9BACT|nr:hypothetical protein [Dyadobacter chenwenxiniae]MCF0062804.1 hypothetical protein [Dyadobacter chenwenxiniae]UON85021.1 hypothetical protein MUK70_08485 [Dyadobacter chenwenxiniae]